MFGRIVLTIGITLMSLWFARSWPIELKPIHCEHGIMSELPNDNPEFKILVNWTLTDPEDDTFDDTYFNLRIKGQCLGNSANKTQLRLVEGQDYYELVQDHWERGYVFCRSVGMVEDVIYYRPTEVHYKIDQWIPQNAGYEVVIIKTIRDFYNRSIIENDPTLSIRNKTFIIGDILHRVVHIVDIDNIKCIKHAIREPKVLEFPRRYPNVDAGCFRIMHFYVNTTMRRVRVFWRRPYGLDVEVRGYEEHTNGSRNLVFVEKGRWQTNNSVGVDISFNRHYFYLTSFDDNGENRSEGTVMVPPQSEILPAPNVTNAIQSKGFRHVLEWSPPNYTVANYTIFVYDVHDFTLYIRNLVEFIHLPANVTSFKLRGDRLLALAIGVNTENSSSGVVLLQPLQVKELP